MGTRGPKRSQSEREHNDQRISELMLRGHTAKQIAGIINNERGLTLSRRQISYDIKRIRENYLAKTNQNIEQLVAFELDRIDTLEQESWAGWRRSLTDAQRIVVETWAGGKKDKRVTDTSYGNPKFLDQVMRCQQERRKLLNLYPAVQMIHQVSKIEIKGYVGVSPDDWDNDAIEGEVIEEGEQRLLPDAQ